MGRKNGAEDGGPSGPLRMKHTEALFSFIIFSEYHSVVFTDLCQAAELASLSFFS
jgi:hypothetical protein